MNSKKKNLGASAPPQSTFKYVSKGPHSSFFSFVLLEVLLSKRPAAVDCAWVRSRAPLVFKAAASVTELLPSWFFPDWSQLVLHDGSQQSVKLQVSLLVFCFKLFFVSKYFWNSYGKLNYFLTVLVWGRGRVCSLFANFWSSHKIAKIIENWKFKQSFVVCQRFDHLEKRKLTFIKRLDLQSIF